MVTPESASLSSRGSSKMVRSMWLMTMRSVGWPAALMKSATSCGWSGSRPGWTLIAAPVSAAAISAACITRFSVSVHGAWQPISPIMPARTSVPQAPCRIWPIISSAKSSTGRPWFFGSW